MQELEESIAYLFSFVKDMVIWQGEGESKDIIGKHIWEERVTRWSMNSYMAC